jgi:hypothetical protein
MIHEGWSPVAPGVLQRRPGGTQVETFAIGPEGMRWAVRELETRLAALVREHRAHPRRDLRRVIRDLRQAVAGLRADLELQEADAEPLAGAFEKTCTPSYGASADAYPLTGTAGAGATASASFGGGCGYFAETHAYTLARATRSNGLIDQHEQTHPQTGYDIASGATASAQGTTHCYSEAYAYARYSPANIFQSVFDSNTSCTPPPAPPTAWISGPARVFVPYDTEEAGTWNAMPSGGVPPYSYQWYWEGSPVGTGSSYSRSFYADGVYRVIDYDLSVTVTDSLGQNVTAVDTPRIYYNNETNDCLTYRDCTYRDPTE